MDMMLVIFEALRSVLGLREDDFEWSRSPFGLIARINRKYGSRRLKMIIIDANHKEVCILYEEFADSYDISALTHLGEFNVYPIKHIGEDDNPDSYYFDPQIDGVCVKTNYR